ncbi:MAG: hypothetical protein [Circoviridae sp.]|nr:MAG: hypothetical protein [Circoviridae sp.]
MLNCWYSFMSSVAWLSGSTAPKPKHCWPEVLTIPPQRDTVPPVSLSLAPHLGVNTVVYFFLTPADSSFCMGLRLDPRRFLKRRRGVRERREYLLGIFIID